MTVPGPTLSGRGAGLLARNRAGMRTADTSTDNGITTTYLETNAVYALF